ncbi:hypothetical protein HDV57DRAFT_112321 [Trichoderma longibrachiatum]
MAPNRHTTCRWLGGSGGGQRSCQWMVFLGPSFRAFRADAIGERSEARRGEAARRNAKSPWLSVAARASPLRPPGGRLWPSLQPGLCGRTGLIARDRIAAHESQRRVPFPMTTEGPRINVKDSDARRGHTSSWEMHGLARGERSKRRDDLRRG